MLKIKKKYNNSNINANRQYLKIIKNYIKINSDNVRIN